MLESRAIIIRLDGGEAIVEADGAGGCGLCNSTNGCGSGKLSKLFCASPRQFRVQNDINAQVGDAVQVSVQDGVLLRSAFMAYIFPLLLVFAGAALGTLLAGAQNQDAYAACGALAGLAAGFVLVRRFAVRQQLPVSALCRVNASAGGNTCTPANNLLPPT